jgi:hypothetical protein
VIGLARKENEWKAYFEESRKARKTSEKWLKAS